MNFCYSFRIGLFLKRKKHSNKLNTVQDDHERQDRLSGFLPAEGEDEDGGSASSLRC